MLYVLSRVGSEKEDSRSGGCCGENQKAGESGRGEEGKRGSVSYGWVSGCTMEGKGVLNSVAEKDNVLYIFSKARIF